jgi:exopolysaccharide production protein ExoQ
MKKLLQLLEQGFVVFSLLVYSGGVFILVLSGGMGQGDSAAVYDTTLLRVIRFSIYALTASLLILRWQQTLYALSRSLSVWLLVFIAAFSIIWSYDPASTLKDSITLIGSSLFGIYLASHYSWRQQLHLIGWMFGISILLSFAFALALPQYGIMREVGSRAWRGIYIHKNGLGGLMSMSTVIFALLAIGTRKHRLILLAFCGLSVILMLFAQSTSAIFNLLILVVVVLFARTTIKWRDEVAVLGFTLTLLLLGSFSIFFTFNAASIFGLAGKDLTLTGRTSIWIASLEMIGRHPLFGYGFGGFWHGFNGESAYIWRTTGWNPTHPHNGFIALCLDLGLLGIFLFGFTLLSNLRRSLGIMRQTTEVLEGSWALMFLTYLILANLTETDLLSSDNMLWIFYLTVTSSLRIPLKYHFLPDKQVEKAATI